LHALFGFKWTLAQESPGAATKDYMRDAGGTMARVWGGLRYALGSVWQVNAVGPKSLNGGEVVVGAGKSLMKFVGFWTRTLVLSTSYRG
jgi:hypothetical protein